MNVLRVENLSFSYLNEKKVLNGVDFRFNNGVFYIIAGPNGCGKTTFLKILCGIYKNYKGGLFLNRSGIVYNMKFMKNIDIASYISYVPGDISIYFDFSAMDVILMGRRRFKGIFETYNYKDKEAVYDVAKDIGILNIIDSDFNKLSNGERQLVLIAQAIVQDTDIVLVDEPTSHLDIKHKVDILKVLKDMSHEKGKTVIAVMHELKAAAHFSDEIIFMKDGRFIYNIKSSDFENKLLEISKVYDIDLNQIKVFL